MFPMKHLDIAIGTENGNEENGPVRNGAGTMFKTTYYIGRLKKPTNLTKTYSGSLGIANTIRLKTT